MKASTCIENLAEEERETAVAVTAATEAARRADLFMVKAFGCLENFGVEKIFLEKWENREKIEEYVFV